MRGTSEVPLIPNPPDELGLNSNRPTIFVMGGADGVLSAADLIITKTGGLTVSEALTKVVPLLIHKPIPGQEEENANFIKKIGAGKISLTSAEFERIMDYLLNFVF